MYLSFGGVAALEDVSFDISDGAIYSIIGPNGAGKSSLLNVINGVYKPDRGSVMFRNVDCTRADAQVLANAGIGRTFQSLALFKGLSVIDNVLVGRHGKIRSGVFLCGLYWGPAQREEAAQRKVALEILDFLEIGHLRDTPVENLSYGLQKRVEIARALATAPSLLLLDEPMAGMNHQDKRDVVRLIRAVNKSRATTIVLIEHDMGVVMDLSDRVLVLDHGVCIAVGPPAAIRSDARVIKAYLGDEEQ